jgi:hypothetical protein
MPMVTPDAGNLDLPGAPRPGAVRVRPTVAIPRRAPLPVAAVVASIWAALLTYAPLLVLAIAVGTGTGVADAARFTAAGWLLAYGVPVPAGSATISLTPLLLTAFVVWRCARAGVHTSRAVAGRGLRRVAVAGAAVGVVQAGLATVVAVWVGASPGRAALNLGLLGGAAAGFGALRHSRAGRARLRRLPAAVRDAGRTGISAAALVLSLGAVVAGAALAIRGGDAASMLASYHAGLRGQAGLSLLCLVYAPNLMIWAASYLLGPGFAVGVGTVISPGLVAVGPIPTVPVFAGLPHSAVSGPGSLLLGVPLVAAMVAGALYAGRLTDSSWGGLLGGAALAGPVAGVLLGLAALASGGALGSQRLAVIGPDAGGVGLWGGVVVAVGAVLGAVAVRALTRPVRVDL